MKNIIQWILLCILILGSSYKNKEDVPKYKELRQNYLSQQELLNSSIDSNCKLEEEIMSLKSNPYIVTNLIYQNKSKLYEEIKVSGNIPGTNFYLAKNKGISIGINNKFYTALLECNGPPVNVTSMHRRNNRKSNHYYSRALDIRTDRAGIEFIRWMMTLEGFVWRYEFGINFYVEDKSNSRFLKRMIKIDPSIKKHILVNPKATGPHVHLELSRKSNSI